MTAPRLKEKYKNEIVSKLKSELEIANINDVPRLEKIVVNMGVGAAASDHKLLDAAMNDMRIITGQQPCITRAKKSIAGFHVREGQAIGCKVTLRREKMYDFLDKLPGVLKPGGKVAILTFHSGEDRLVKKSFKQWKKEGLYSEIAKDVIRPSKEECFRNSRAKCTKMRWAIRAEE